MKNKTYRRFYLLSLALIVLLSAYPIYMGVKVAIEYLTNGFIFQANYPKYVIPYTPMCTDTQNVRRRSSRPLPE